MSDGIAVKAEFADRIDKLTELAECERQVQAAAHRYEAAEMALVSAAEDLQEWSNQWSKCRENVIRALPDMLTADALTWYGSGSRLGDANAFIRRYCDEIEARRQAHGWPALTPAPEIMEAPTSDDANPIEGASEGQPVPGTGEESRDHSDDASEFAEVSESKPFRVYSERGDVAGVQSFDTITQARAFANEEISLDAKKIEVFSGDDRLFEWPVVEPEPLADPIWNEPEPTKPEADALAKAADYYSPEAVAERNKFNPFGMFRKEGDQ